MIKLDFAVIGTQKSGSTYILKNLRDHPSIQMPYDEVPYFEDPDFNSGKKLIDYFRKNKSNKILGIKRPNYFAKKEVPSRLIANNPEIKLILFLRNPSERLISAYFHGMKMGFLPALQINKGLTKILTFDKIFFKNYPYSKQLIDYGYYSIHLKNYLKYFKKENIYIGFFEDFKNNPLLTIKKIYKFLEINENYVPNFLEEKPMESIFSLTRLRFRQFIYSLTFSYTDDVRMHKKVGFHYFFIRKVLNGIDKSILKVIFNEKKPNIEKKLKDKIDSIYLSDIKELEKILNKKLEIWYKN